VRIYKFIVVVLQDISYGYFYYINCTYSLKIHQNLSTELDSSEQINYPALSNHVTISSLPVLSLSQYFFRLSILLTSFQLLNLLVLCFNQYYLYFRIEILQFVAFFFLFLSEIWITPVWIQCCIINKNFELSLNKYISSWNLHTIFLISLAEGKTCSPSYGFL
jgi:hypothetical protein